MKIAIVSPMYPYRGGISQFSEMLSDELKKKGFETKAFNFKRLYPDLLFPGKTQYIDDIQNDSFDKHIRCLDSINPISYFQTVSMLKDFAPDILIISYWMSFFVPAYAHIAFRMKKTCKVIALVHNAIPHEPHFFDKPLTALFFKQCSHFVALSENVKNDIRDLQPNANVLLTPHPLYTQFGEKTSKESACNILNISSNKRTLLFFGLIREYKGLDLLIQAMNELDEKYQLLIAGECYGSFDYYQTLIDQSSAKDRIIVHNKYIKDKDIPLFFSASDVLLLPYRSATQSGVLSIAYHYDIPVVATPVGDFKETVSFHKTGLVTSGISSSALVDSISEMFEDKKPESFKDNIDHVKKELSWETFSKKIMDFANN